MFDDFVPPVFNPLISQPSISTSSKMGDGEATFGQVAAPGSTTFGGGVIVPSPLNNFIILIQQANMAKDALFTAATP